MNKENKKLAQQKRAEEKKRQERNQMIKKLVLALAVIIVFVAVIIYGVWESKQSDTKEEQTQQTETKEEKTEVSMGDTVSIDYVGTVNDIAFQGGTGSYNLVIGSHSFIDDFEEQLVGHKVGETVEVVVTFPEGYSGTYQDANGEDHSLSNVEAVFMVTINGILN